MGLQSLARSGLLQLGLLQRALVRLLQLLLHTVSCLPNCVFVADRLPDCGELAAGLRRFSLRQERIAQLLA